MEALIDKIIKEIEEKYKKSFPKDFYLWSEYGFWIQEIMEAKKKILKQGKEKVLLTFLK